MSTPNWNGWLASIWGPSWEDDAGVIPADASNVVLGTNPPYTVQDFLAIYPKYGGTPLSITGVTAASGSATATLPSTGVSGIAIGNPIADSGGLYPDGTVVKAIGSGTLTMSNPATADGTTNLTIWNAPLVPFAVLVAYIALASGCLIQARWQEIWLVAMSLFIAHYVTLFLTSDGSGATTASQAATQGISSGIRISKSVGDVSVGYQAIQGIDEWGAYNLTIYGQQLATLAKGVGNGPLFLY